MRFSENIGYVDDCYVERRADDESSCMFLIEEGKCYCFLSGYAIIPKEKYFKLLKPSFLDWLKSVFRE